MNEFCLLSLVVAPEVEDSVSDWLLAQPDLSGFSSHPVSGHGSSQHAMSLAEQVAGRRRQVLFQMHLPTPHAQRLLEQVKRQFNGSGMHYWLLPLIDAGHLDG